MRSPPNARRFHKPPSNSLSALEMLARIGLLSGNQLAGGSPTITESTTPVQFNPDTEIQARIKQATQELNTQGITSEQRKGYQGRLSEAFYRDVSTLDYHELDRPERLARLIGDIAGPIHPRGPMGALGLGVIADSPLPAPPEKQNRSDRAWRPTNRALGPPGSEDAWRLYLGMPQEYNTFDISSYVPTNDTTGKPYFKIKEFGGSMINEPDSLKQLVSAIKKGSDEWGDPFKTPNRMLQNDNTGYFSSGDTTSEGWAHGRNAGIMQNFQLSLGHDDKGAYIAYYDKWDLDVPHADKVGKPFEIYDRIYYDPDTYRVIPETKTAKAIEALARIPKR